MLGAIGSLFGTIIVGTTVFTMNLLFMALASLLRLMPLFLPLLGRVVWGVLVYSCRLYYLLLGRVAPLVERLTRVKILEGLCRLGVILSLSLLLGLGFLLVAQIPITVWTVLPFVLHGIFVDAVWNEIPGLGSLETGTRL
jgi:hypothetical protein